MTKLTSKQLGFLIIILDFCEENWDRFKLMCIDNGIPENEIGAELDKLKETVYNE